MLKRLKQRINNAGQMHKYRTGHPDEIRNALEERARQPQDHANIPPAKAGPVILFFRWLLYLLTALIILIVLIGVPRTEQPMFTLFSLCLLLSFLYLAASLANPAIVFYRNSQLRQYRLELFGFLSILFIFLMVLFRP